MNSMTYTISRNEGTSPKENKTEVIFNNGDKIIFRKFGNDVVSMQDLPSWLLKSSELYQEIKKKVCALNN